jgi:salicylate hydroxylase
MRILIAGCGIGGAALALALQRLGRECVLLEQAPRLEAVGAGVQLSPNGMHVLSHLGVAESLGRVAFEPRDLRYRDWRTGETLLRNPLMPSINEHFGAPYLHAHRADLIDALIAPLDRKSLRLGRRIVRVGQERDRAYVALDDGTVEEGDVLVGADGIHSLVRSQAFSADSPQASGCIAFRGLVNAETARHLNISPSAHVWMGPGYSAVIYYISAGAMINWLCIGSSPQARKESWSAKATVDEVLSIYEGWNSEVTGLVELTEQPFVTALYDRAPLEHWVNGRIALIGDAAHAMLPYHAQGAVQSMEDAWVLARCLAQSDASEVRQALFRYESLRKDRATRIQAQSRAQERRMHMSDPAEVAARNAKLRKYDAEFEGKFLPQQEWLFGYDAELAALGEDHRWRALRPW